MVDYSLRKRPKKSIDKRAVMKDEDLRRRTRLAINFIAEIQDLTNETMANKMGAKIWNLANYRTMKTSPKYEFVISFCKTFDFNEDWLWKGKGDPFPGARAKYPNYFVPEDSPGHGYIEDATDPYATASKGLINPTAAPAQEFSVAEDLILAKSVLESRTHYATALHLNIRSFVAGVSAVTTVSRCQDDLRVQGKLIAQLQARLDGMDKQNSKLREEMEVLKKTSGDSPPIALEMDHAARTGTDDPGI